MTNTAQNENDYKTTLLDFIETGDRVLKAWIDDTDYNVHEGKI